MRHTTAVQNWTVSYLSNGEGFHNYHHAFPWDYRAAELGSYNGNWSTAFIDLMAKIGWAYDFKTVSKDMIAKRSKRVGDGTWKDAKVWGWGDKDIDINDLKRAQLISQTG